MNLGNPSCTQGALTPINIGLFISVPISSTPGSPGLSYRQPFLAGHIFSSAGVLIGSEVFLLLAQYLFKLETIPTLDLQNQQIIQMPISELQEFLNSLNTNAKGSISQSSLPIGSSIGGIPPSSVTGARGFITGLPAEAPTVFSLYITSDFANNLYSPNVWILIPIFALPGLRGALPFLILVLLATILVRTVVAPETTGAKPTPKKGDQPNSSLNFSPEELLRFLSRFGKYFNSQ
jgi:hypothetical protein